MIGRLSGLLALKASDYVMIDVNGVGYVVYCSERTIADLPNPPEAISLWTEMLVREDLLQLFGFLTQTEREWHRLLTSVQGIGAKASLAILGTLGAEGVGRAIALGDANAVRAAPGVGPKIAARVVNELAGKAPAMMMEANAPATPGNAPATAPKASPSAPAPQKTTSAGTAEALSALTNLGYAPMDASRAVAEAADEGATDTADLIRAALKRLAPGE